MRPFREILPFLAWLAVLAPLPSARATTFMAIEFPQTVAETPVIARGTIGSSYSDWVPTPDGGRRLYTFYQLNLGEVIKGDAPAGNTLVVRELGGEKGGVGMNVAGSAHLDAGEDVVLLLSARNPDGSYEIRDLMMGKMVVQKDDSGDEVLKGPAISAAKQGELVHGDEATGPKRWTLAALRQLVDARRPPRTPPRAPPPERPTAIPSAQPSTPAPLTGAESAPPGQLGGGDLGLKLVAAGALLVFLVTVWRLRKG